MKTDMTDDQMNTILTRLEDSDENITEFGPSWSQGRAAFGGLVGAFASLSMRKLIKEQKPIRSFMASFIAPTPAGPIKTKAYIQREGKSVTQCSSSVFSEEGNLCLQAMGVFGSSRETLNVQPHNDFNPISRNDGIRFSEAKRFPQFLENYDGCWVGPGIPGSGASETLTMWVKHRCNMSEYPAESILAIADMPPPVLLSHFKDRTVPASSVTWSVEFLIEPDSFAHDWFYLEFKMDGAKDGYTQQSGRIFTEDGELCALTRQCMVYFG